MWYTVYDAKNGNLLASGTSDMCARRLGYKSANSFASSVYHCRSKKEEPARAPTRTSQKGDEFRRPSPQKYHNVRQTARR
jgi:hypothetical protein